MNWDYLAGFFDGEGSFVLTTDRAGERKSINVQIHISQTDRDVLVLMLNFLTVHGIGAGLYTRIKSSPLSTKPIHILQICNRNNVSLLLSALLPRLHVKRQRAEDTLRFLKIFPAMIKGSNCEQRQRELYWQGMARFQRRALKSTDRPRLKLFHRASL